MAKPTKRETEIEQKARELYFVSENTSGKNWNDLTDDEQEPWFAKATSDMEKPPVPPVLDPAAPKKPEDPKKGEPKIPVPTIIKDPLSRYRDSKGRIKVETPAPGRYVITGFTASGVFIPGVGTLAPPDRIDIPMNDDTADAVQAIVADYRASKEAALAEQNAQKEVPGA
jgi:hypothetical protein